jgi:hypothetical protein
MNIASSFDVQKPIYVEVTCNFSIKKYFGMLNDIHIYLRFSKYQPTSNKDEIDSIPQYIVVIKIPSI